MSNLIQTKLLLTGQNAPFTSESCDGTKFDEISFTAYSSGNGSIFLQYKSPIFQDDWVTFYEFEKMKTGYAPAAHLTTPVTEIRAVSSGVGKFWLAYIGR